MPGPGARPVTACNSGVSPGVPVCRGEAPPRSSRGHRSDFGDLMLTCTTFECIEAQWPSSNFLANQQSWIEPCEMRGAADLAESGNARQEYRQQTSWSTSFPLNLIVRSWCSRCDVLCRWCECGVATSRPATAIREEQTVELSHHQKVARHHCIRTFLPVPAQRAIKPRWACSVPLNWHLRLLVYSSSASDACHSRLCCVRSSCDGRSDRQGLADGACSEAEAQAVLGSLVRRRGSPQHFWPTTCR